MDWTGFGPVASSMLRTIMAEGKTLERYLDISCLSGISERHLYKVEQYLRHHLEYTGYSIDKSRNV